MTVHYTGKLTNGTTFDSSVDRGSPIDLPVSGVIPGWVEGLQLMHVGEKYELYIPSDLAYGAQSPSPAIPANSVLVFDLELLAIKDPAKKQPLPSNQRLNTQRPVSTGRCCFWGMPFEIQPNGRAPEQSDKRPECG